MDDDLEAMRGEQLIAEARRLRAGRSIGTAPDTRSAGITRLCGVSCPRRQTRCLRCPRGRSRSGGVGSIANPWIGIV